MKRKEQRKKLKADRKAKNQLNQAPEIDQALKLIIYILIVIGILFLIVSILRDEINIFNKPDAEETEVIQSEEKLASQSFSIDEEEYYIIYMNFSETLSDTVQNAISSFKTSDDYRPTYTVDMEKGFNSNYLSEDDEHNVVYGELKTLKVTVPTIVHIKDEKVLSVETGYESIMAIVK